MLEDVPKKSYNYTHRLSRSKIYTKWLKIKARCNYPKDDSYANYGWRWISYDPRWEDFINFYNDMHEWYADHLSIDRIDNNLWYSKENCKWATRSEQQSNRRNNIVYMWKTLMQWSIELSIKYWTLRSRINRWQPIHKALWFEE